MPVTPEKCDEIWGIWDSPKFDTNNERLIHLFRPCRKVEHGYTIRDFAYTLFPHRMAQNRERSPIRTIHQMFRRFRIDTENHEVLLLARIKDGKWYYYNMIEDEDGFKEYRLRQAKVLLGMEKMTQKMEDILDMSAKERQRKSDELTERLRQKHIKAE